MRGKRLFAAVLFLAATTVAAVVGLWFGPFSQAGGIGRGVAPGGPFVVHEWGTFTSFSGSDGVKLEFRPLADVDLPPFVLNRPRQAGIGIPFSKAAIPVVQRMETPVTYFYSDRPRQVRVRVGFPRGLLTEFFPPVAEMKPDISFAENAIVGSLLDWGRVWIVPEKCLAAEVGDPAATARLREQIRRRLPQPSVGFDHYAVARETDADLVYVEQAFDPSRPLFPHGAWFEKFLFYRGIGNFALPLEVTAQPGGKFVASNHGPLPIRSLFLVTVDGERLRFTTYDELPSGGRLELAQSVQAATADQLSGEVKAALVRAGLYDKEAAAMVNTWRSSWFGEQGTRLFYLLPEPLTDELLPLTIEPAPDERLRVMVGRLEIMRPEDEALVTELVRQSARDRAAAAALATSGSPAMAIPKAIINLGRLAGPALVRVSNTAADAAVRGEAAILLQQLRAAPPGTPVADAPGSFLPSD
jgi:hypothetical protein